MKSIRFLSLEWLHTRGTILLIVIFLLSIVNLPAAQEGAATQETESQRIYRQAYEAAMADSPEINLALQPAMVGGAVLPTLGIEARW